MKGRSNYVIFFDFQYNKFSSRTLGYLLFIKKKLYKYIGEKIKSFLITRPYIYPYITDFS
jgi:hypothetical protein